MLRWLPLLASCRLWPLPDCCTAAAQVPVVDGYSLAHLSKRLNVAGRHVTAYLVELLMRRGYALNRWGVARWVVMWQGQCLVWPQSAAVTTDTTQVFNTSA